MSTQLSQCPEQFYLNCSNAPSRCKFCAASKGDPNGKLLYKPIEDIGEHPYVSSLVRTVRQINKTRSKQVKSGLKQERKLQQQIAQQTLRSGAILGDGDLKILEGLIQADSKRRHNTQSFTVTKKEYEEGRKAGTNCWLITVDMSGKETTMACLTMDAFTTLLGIAASHTNDNSNPTTQPNH